VNLLSLHLMAGAVAMASGLVALYAVKGATVHRRAGTFFVYAMLSMSVSGVLMVASGHTVSSANLAAGVLITYLVITAVTTVGARSARVQWLDRGAMLAVLALGLVSVVSAIGILAAADRSQRGLAFVLLIFGVIALPSGVGDLRMIRASGLRGAPRLKRHLWRMCFALFIATASFFLGTGRRIPESLHIGAFRVIPLVVLVTMVVWLWRLRRKPLSQRVMTVGVPEPV
jgi:uncharacterized membrane protein